MKTHMCITLPIEIKQQIEDNSKAFGYTQSKLLLEGYFEFVKNHVHELKRPVNLTVTQIQAEPRKLKVQTLFCEVGQCKNKQNGSLGEYQGKIYKLCSDHSNKLAGVKGWKIT